MFSSVIHQIDVDSILIDRANRQRSVITPESVLSLAVSIGKSQWISPILVDEETHYLIAGERRLMAVKILRAAVQGDYSLFTDPNSASEVLFPVCTCRKDSWKQWNKIPAQLGKNLSPTDLALFEFIENAHRQDLSWQDKAKAIYTVHCQELKTEANWTATQTATLLGIGPKTVQENLRVWRVYCDEDATSEVKSIIEGADTIKAAVLVLERHTSRREITQQVSLNSGGVATPKPKLETSLTTKPGPAKGTDVYLSKGREESFKNLEHSEDEGEYDEADCFATPAPPNPAANLLINADFISWADTYNDEPFNFIHCDFPYETNNSIDTYWKLLEALNANRDKLLAPQAHIMVWFSQTHRREIEDFFKQMGGFVQPSLMIWTHENVGITHDPKRYGSRNYETAMLISFGDRRIVVPRNLCITHPSKTDTYAHRSQKPTGVLEHFFEMFVDNSSTVLDPTARPGTSLVAAKHLNASRIVGLEADKEIYTNSCQYINTLLG